MTTGGLNIQIGLSAPCQRKGAMVVTTSASVVKCYILFENLLPFFDKFNTQAWHFQRYEKPIEKDAPDLESCHDVRCRWLWLTQSCPDQWHP